MSVFLSIYLSICKLENQAILRDVLRFWTWQHQKRSNSARLPQCLNLTTSKTKKSARLLHFSKLTTSKTNQVCETSSIFELNRNNSARLLHFSNLTTSKTKQFCETSFKNGKLRAALTASYQCVLRFFPSTCLNYRACHEKVMPGHTKCCTCHAKSSQQTWRSDAPKYNPSEENQHLDLLTSLMNMSLVLRLPRKMHLCRSSSNVPRLPSFLEMLQNPHVLLTFEKVNVQKWSEPLVLLTCWLRNVLRATTACTFSTSQLPKVVRPDLVCFVHFDFKMCFAPQRRHFFQQRNFQVLGTCGVLCILTWKCASHHNGVQFFISHLARWLRTRRFSEPTDRPSGATNHWRNIVFRDFPTFSPTCIFFLLTLSLLWSSLFYSSLLSDSSHLCFSSVHILRSLTSKLPSVIYIYLFYIHTCVCVSSYDPNPMHDVLNMSRCPKFRWPRLLSTKSQKLDELRNFVPEAEAGAVLRSARLERLVRLQFQWIY